MKESNDSCQCNVCGEQFTVKYKKSLTDKEKPFQFDVCGNCHANKDDCKKKNISKDEDLHPYKCDVCGSSFIDSVECQHHLRKHW